MHSFYGGQQGQSFALKAIFSNRAEDMLQDLKARWYSPINVGEYVFISYGDPSYNRISNTEKIEQTVPEGKSYTIKNKETGLNEVYFPSFEITSKSQHELISVDAKYSMVLKYGRRYIVRYDDVEYICDCLHHYKENYNYLGNLRYKEPNYARKVYLPFYIENVSATSGNLKIACDWNGKHRFSISLLEENNSNQSYQTNMSVDLSKLGKSYNGTLWQKIYVDRNLQVTPRLPLNDENVYVFLKAIKTTVNNCIVTQADGPVKFNTKDGFTCNSEEAFETSFFKEALVLAQNDPSAAKALFGSNGTYPNLDESITVFWRGKGQEISRGYRYTYIPDASEGQQWRQEDASGFNDEYTTQELTVKGENANLILAEEDFGFGYKLITSLAGVTPRIQVTSIPINIEDGDPHAKIDLSKPDEPVLSLYMQRGQRLNQVNYNVLNSEEFPSLQYYTDNTVNFSPNLLKTSLSILPDSQSSSGMFWRVNDDLSITMWGDLALPTSGADSINFFIGKNIKLFENTMYHLSLDLLDGVWPAGNIQLYLKVDEIDALVTRDGQYYNEVKNQKNEIGLRLSGNISIPEETPIHLKLNFTLGASKTRPVLTLNLPKAKSFLSTPLLAYEKSEKLKLVTTTPVTPNVDILNAVTIYQREDNWVGIIGTVLYCGRYTLQQLPTNVFNDPAYASYLYGSSEQMPVGEKQGIKIYFRELVANPTVIDPDLIKDPANLSPEGKAALEANLKGQTKYIARQLTEVVPPDPETSSPEIPASWDFIGLDEQKELTTAEELPNFIDKELEYIRYFEDLYNRSMKYDICLSSLTKALFKITDKRSSTIATKNDVVETKEMDFEYIDLLLPPVPKAQSVAIDTYKDQKLQQITITSEEDKTSIPHTQRYNFNIPKVPETKTKLSYLPPQTLPTISRSISGPSEVTYNFALPVAIQFLTSQNSQLKMENLKVVEDPLISPGNPKYKEIHTGDYYLHLTNEYTDPNRGNVYYCTGRDSSGKTTWVSQGSFLGAGFTSHVIHTLKVEQNSSVPVGSVKYDSSRGVYQINSSAVIEDNTFMEKAKTVQAGIPLYGKTQAPPKFGEVILLNLYPQGDLTNAISSYHLSYTPAGQTLWGNTKITGTASIVNQFKPSGTSESYSVSYVNGLFDSGAEPGDKIYTTTQIDKKFTQQKTYIAQQDSALEEKITAQVTNLVKWKVF